MNGLIQWLGLVFLIVMVLTGFIYKYRLKKLRAYRDEWDLVLTGEDNPNAVIADQRRKNRWANSGAVGKASARPYAEVSKGPDRPTRGRQFGKPGMTNRNERNTLDWQTEMLTNRIIGRRNAQKFTKKPPPPPKKKARPK